MPARPTRPLFEKLPGVIAVMEAGGQFQVVIGNNVPLLYAELGRISQLTGDTDLGEAAKGNLFNRFVAMISSIFLPFLWTLAGAALLKASSVRSPTSAG